MINDFGISRIIGVQGFSTILLLDIRYNAPELVPLHDVPNQVITPTTQSDIFSFGILLLQVSFCSSMFSLSRMFISFLQLCHGPDNDTQRGLPYNHIRLTTTGSIHRDMKLLRLVHAGERPKRERYLNISDDYWGIMQWCWNGDAAIRPTIMQVMTYLQVARF